MIRALLSSVIIFLALVQNGPPEQLPPPDRYTCTPPAGVTLHLTNPQLQVDSTGRVFCATRGKSDTQGGIVWTMDGDHPRILIPTDASRYYANGEFVIISNWLYYASVDKAASRIEAIVVPEWTP